MKSEVHNVVAGDRLSAFERSLASGNSEASVAVIEQGAPWPEWLDGYLTGRQEVLVLCQLEGESRTALAKRLGVKVQGLSNPVHQLVWVARRDAAPQAVLEALGGLEVRLSGPSGIVVALGSTLMHYVEMAHGDVLMALSTSDLADLSDSPMLHDGLGSNGCAPTSSGVAARSKSNAVDLGSAELGSIDLNVA